MVKKGKQAAATPARGFGELAGGDVLLRLLRGAAEA